MMAMGMKRAMKVRKNLEALENASLKNDCMRLMCEIDILCYEQQPDITGPYTSVLLVSALSWGGLMQGGRSRCDCQDAIDNSGRVPAWHV